MSVPKKYFWLKLKRDFFKRHDITIIEALPNGKDYVLFYLKLLVESIDHNGELRFSDTVPYNADMLAALTRTNIDVVRSAVKVFSELGMMDQMDDGTLYMRQIESMIGQETDAAERMRRKRATKEIEAPKENTSKPIERKHEYERNMSEQCSLSGEKCAPEYRVRDRVRDKDKEIRDPPAKKTTEKHKHGSQNNVLLTDEEHSRLAEDLGSESLAECIEFYSLYKAEKGYTSKSDNLAIRRWVVNAVKERKGSPGENRNSDLKVHQRTAMLDLREA